MKWLRRLSQKENFQHQPSILSWKILASLVFTCCRKSGNAGRPIVSACNCPTELITTYLDGITTSLVQSLPSYVKDTNHMLHIADSFRFPGTSNFVFTLDVKSSYTVIPIGDGLLALTHFPNKRPVLQPPTLALIRLAELVLTLNIFSFNGNFYRDRREGSRWGAVWDLIMRFCSWDMSSNKSSLSTRERNQPFTKDISMTSWVPLPEVEMRSKLSLIHIWRCRRS